MSMSFKNNISYMSKTTLKERNNTLISQQLQNIIYESILIYEIILNLNTPSQIEKSFFSSA